MSCRGFTAQLRGLTDDSPWAGVPNGRDTKREPSSFARNSGGEQIDGAFKLDDWHYIVECRWRERLADIRQLDGLYGQVQRSGRQTMGLYLSVNGGRRMYHPC